MFLCIEKLMLFVVIFTIITRFEFIYIFYIIISFAFRWQKLRKTWKWQSMEQLYGFVKVKKDKKGIVKIVYLFELNISIWLFGKKGNQNSIFIVIHFHVYEIVLEVNLRLNRKKNNDTKTFNVYAFHIKYQFFAGFVCFRNSRQCHNII